MYRSVSVCSYRSHESNAYRVRISHVSSTLSVRIRSCIACACLECISFVSVMYRSCIDNVSAVNPHIRYKCSPAWPHFVSHLYRNSYRICIAYVSADKQHIRYKYSAVTYRNLYRARIAHVSQLYRNCIEILYRRVSTSCILSVSYTYRDRIDSVSVS